MVKYAEIQQCRKYLPSSRPWGFASEGGRICKERNAKYAFTTMNAFEYLTNNQYGHFVTVCVFRWK